MLADNHIQKIIDNGLLSYSLQLPALRKLFILSITFHCLIIILPFFMIFMLSKIWFIDSAFTYLQLGVLFIFISALLLISGYLRDIVFSDAYYKYSTEISTGAVNLMCKLPYSYLGYLPVESQFIRYAPLRKFTDVWFNGVVKPLLDLPLVIMSFSIIGYLLGPLYLSFVIVMVSLIIFVNKNVFKVESSDGKVADARFNGALNDVIDNITFIRKHNRLDDFKDYLNKLNDIISVRNFSFNIKLAMRDNISEYLLKLLYVGSISFSVFYTVNGTLEVRFLIIIVALIWFCISPFKMAIDIFIKAKDLKALVSQFKVLVNAGTHVNRHKKIILNDEFKGTIKLDNVCFWFSNASSFALNNLNFNLCQGEVLLVNGQSGSGKSTVCKLIAGIYQPSSGVVSIGIDRALLDKKALLEKVLLVSHDSFLMNESLIDNIRFANTELNTRQVIQLVEDLDVLSCLNNNIELFRCTLNELRAGLISNENYDKLIHKVILSKINKFNHAKIILLDEPFIDDLGDDFKYLAKTVKFIKHNNTIVIASRYNYYSPLADKIMILSGGRVVKYFRKSEAD